MSDSNKQKMINIIIIYGHTPNDIFYYPTRVSLGTTIKEAVDNSPLYKVYPDIDHDNISFAIFGRSKKEDVELKENDRIEVLRPRTYNPRKTLLSDKNRNKQ